jgi:RecJ-like exonuclease
MKYRKCEICDGAGTILVPTDRKVADGSEGADVDGPIEVQVLCEDCCGTGRDYSVDNESNKVIRRPSKVREPA